MSVPSRSRKTARLSQARAAAAAALDRLDTSMPVHAAMIERALTQHAGTAPDVVGQHDVCADRAGRVSRSSVGPNIAITGNPSAAAKCIAPESLVTSARHGRALPASVGRSVRPTRFSRAAAGSGCRRHRGARSVVNLRTTRASKTARHARPSACPLRYRPAPH